MKNKPRKIAIERIKVFHNRVHLTKIPITFQLLKSKFFTILFENVHFSHQLVIWEFCLHEEESKFGIVFYAETFFQLILLEQILKLFYMRKLDPLRHLKKVKIYSAQTTLKGTWKWRLSLDCAFPSILLQFLVI